MLRAAMSLRDEVFSLPSIAFIIALEVDSPITLHIKDCTEKFTVAFSLEKEKKAVFNLLMEASYLIIPNAKVLPMNI